MTGYMNFNDPEDPKPKSYIPPGKTRADIDLDVRDLLSNMVGAGYSSWEQINTDLDAKAKYGSLVNKVGRPMANKLVTQVISFSSRPDSQNKSTEQKIQSFYDIGSNDQDVSGVLKNIKSMGYGVIPGYRESALFGNQQLGGRIDPVVAASTEQSEKVKNIIDKSRNK